jgi:hypothetical protein
MKFLAAALLSVALIACGDDSAPENKPTPATAVRTEDPCVAVRARLFAYESDARLFGFAAGSGGWNNPFTQSDVDNYKLSHPTCFF